MLPFASALQVFMIIFQAMPISVRTFVVVVIIFLIVPGALRLFLEYSG